MMSAGRFHRFVQQYHSFLISPTVWVPLKT